ncbi:outer membrane efflux protein [Rhodopirellula sallentina SM41]|uniref:Outer membrane efflux protein n=2 Tax=Rhodopirellula TaxID=265488 RepID=M5U488_9BACT|nr:outer membrane efflux protein [Rhodopirellula sallentina SM41]
MNTPNRTDRDPTPDAFPAFGESLRDVSVPQPQVAIAGGAVSRSKKSRRRTGGSTAHWGLFSIVMWSLVTGGILSVFSGVLGCRASRAIPETVGNDTTRIDAIMKQVDAGAPPSEMEQITAAETAPLPPITIRDADSLENAEYFDLTLADTIRIALSNSEVLRDLGGTVLRAPEQLTTQQTLSLVQTDPQAGIEAALSAFDAQMYAMGKWQNNDRQFNNRFFGGGANSFQQDLHDYVFQTTKRTATGAEFAIRSITDYDANNATGNETPSAWQTQWHAELRQPLLRGGGLTFNRIGGPAALPGVYNGVLIAKTNNDISVAEFRRDARNYVSNVINAYWDLAYAYRDADARAEALERSRLTWRSYEAQKTSNRRGGSAEALAREQYYRFKSEYQDAVAGKLVGRTQVNNASSGGTFAGIGGVLATERRLRLLIGMPVSEGILLRPVDEPITAPMVFDTESLTAEAIRMRAELQQQRLLIKRREMELLAAKNFLLPTLDLISTYRLRGLGKDLTGSDSAFDEIADMDFQEYEAALEFRMPVGFRQAHAAVQNAKLQIARDRAVLDEQQRQIIHDLLAVIAEADRAYALAETSLNRYLAAKDALDALEANREAGLPISLEQLLDSQRRLSESQTRYYLAVTEYMVAIKNVQYETGTLLENTQIMVAGG